MIYTDYERDLNTKSVEKDLYCLNDFDKVIFDGQNALQLWEKISKTRMVINTDGCLDKMLSDLVNSISPDIKFSIANSYIYLVGANNFLNERVKTPNGQEFSTYNQTIEDKRYFFFINVSFEKLYNFWDRVGDILNESFRLGINAYEYSSIHSIFCPS